MPSEILHSVKRTLQYVVQRRFQTVNGSRELQLIVGGKKNRTDDIAFALQWVYLLFTMLLKHFICVPVSNLRNLG